MLRRLARGPALAPADDPVAPTAATGSQTTKYAGAGIGGASVNGFALPADLDVVSAAMAQNLSLAVGVTVSAVDFLMNPYPGRGSANVSANVSSLDLVDAASLQEIRRGRRGSDGSCALRVDPPPREHSWRVLAGRLHAAASQCRWPFAFLADPDHFPADGPACQRHTPRLPLLQQDVAGLVGRRLPRRFAGGQQGCVRVHALDRWVAARALPSGRRGSRTWAMRTASTAFTVMQFRSIDFSDTVDNLGSRIADYPWIVVFLAAVWFIYIVASFYAR